MQASGPARRKAAMRDTGQFIREETGASMVEYSVMLAAIAAVCFTAIRTVGLSVMGMFDSVTWWGP